MIIRMIVLASIACVSSSSASELTYSPAPRVIIQSELKGTWLPRRLLNHCNFDPTQGIVYCSNRCGIDYQVYYCSKRSFGCCHIGQGYCDGAGLLRCRPG
jgi:hypothetical protein